MSYILFATSGGGLATPVSVANGGTGADNGKDGMTNLTSVEFTASAISADWGLLPVPLPASPDPADLEASLIEVIGALQQLFVIQVI